MNAFYCSCHAADEPILYKGKPTAVAGNPKTRHGIIVTASYEARKFGVKATMTVAQAQRLCPTILLIPPNFELYRSYSNHVFSIVHSFTPVVEIFSIDECFADITGSSQFGSPLEIADKLQKDILEKLGLPCSIGISPNKFLAKMASDFRKPMGITEIWSNQLQDILWPIPIEDMFGVGKQTAKRLKYMGIQTIGDLANFNLDKLIRSFGARGKILFERANGIDDTPVEGDSEHPKSIGHSITLMQDTNDEDEIQTTLMNLADQVGRRVRKHQFVGRTISITIRFNNMKTITRSRTLESPTDLTEEIYAHAKSLVFTNLRSHQKIRLLGISVLQLTERADLENKEKGYAVQTSLFSDINQDSKIKQQNTKRLRRLTEVTDKLRNRYGEDIVIRGSMMRQHESNQIRNKKIHGTSLQKDNLYD